ncbi:MAG TPA: AMP-binding protein [Methylomirabilota bacterium]|nr:AMP-binding protein [Methylomirabilota bacterium]
MGGFATRTEVLLGQLEDLRALLSAIQSTNGFYQRKLGKAPVTPRTIAEYREQVPFTFKQELVADQREHPPFGTNLTFPLNRYTRFHQTSGTSGSPLRWLDDPESWDGLVDSWVEVFKAAAVTPQDRIFFAFSFGPFIGFWLAFEAGARLNALCIPGGGLSTTARLSAILENEATVLCCTPTYALRLGEVAGQDRISLASSKVRLLIVAGEPGGSIPATRQKLESLWPTARVFDHHGMTEVGPVTYECPAQPGVLHVHEPAYLAEIINTDGALTSAGEVGELVLTTLRRTGSPLLRYRTGDLVRLPRDWHQAEGGQHNPCTCGRSLLRLEGGILGRSDDMVVIRGVNVFPSAVDEIVRSFPEITEYQARIRSVASLPELELSIETTSTDLAKELTARLQRSFQDRLALRVPVQVVEQGSLPRFEMKARRWVRES